MADQRRHGNKAIVKSLKAVSRAFNTTDRVVAGWAARGMPRHEAGVNRFFYDLDEIYDWKLKRDSGMQAKRMKLDPSKVPEAPDVGDLKAKVERFRVNRADVFAANQMENLHQQSRLRAVRLANRTDEELLAMSEKDAVAWFRGLGVDGAIKYDKEELERSKGVDDVHKVLDAILKAKEILGGQT
jgi:hypothetical protein